MSLLNDMFGIGPRNRTLDAQYYLQTQMRTMAQVPNYAGPELDREIERQRERKAAQMISQPMVEGLTREFTRHQFPEFPVIPNQR